MYKDIMKMTRSGMLLGVGTQAVGSIPGPHSANIAAGIGGFSHFYPAMVSASGAGHTIKYLKKLK